MSFQANYPMHCLVSNYQNAPEKKNIKLKRTSKQLISTLYDNNVDAVRHESVYLSEYVKKSLSLYNLYMHDEENNFYNIVLNK